jgi:hypothetical protein
MKLWLYKAVALLARGYLHETSRSAVGDACGSAKKNDHHDGRCRFRSQSQAPGLSEAV